MGEGKTSEEPRVERAAVLVIGDEVLSGRTQDRNVQTIATALSDLGVDLVEVRIVRDEIPAIVEALRALDARADLVLTTGGIGPTHDDVTADAVAEAVGRPLVEHPDALAVLAEHLRRAGREMNDARRRMARVPEGATLIPNPLSGAPGFAIGRFRVMAGVPSVMQAMLGHVLAGLGGGPGWQSETIEGRGLGEGDIAGGLGAVAAAHAEVRIGSYPYLDGARSTTRIVVRGRDAAKVAAAGADVVAMLDRVEAERSGGRA